MASGALLLPSVLLLLFAGRCAPEELQTDSSESTLSILRCCRVHEDLDRPALDGEVRCVPSTGQFPLEIYSPGASAYLENVPSWWNLHEGVVPSCPEYQVLRYVQRSKSNPYFIFDDGLVITELGDHGTHLNPNEYCLGSNALMACMNKTEGHPAAATMKPRLRKCCGENAAYEK